MKRRVLSMNYTDNHTNDGIVRIVGVVMAICGAAALFIAGSLVRWPSLELPPCMHIPVLKPRAANAQILRTYRCTSNAGIRHTVRVTHRRNGRSVTVRINDRGPFVRGRVIDLTPAGARALGFSGLAPVKVDLAQN